MLGTKGAHEESQHNLGTNRQHTNNSYVHSNHHHTEPHHLPIPIYFNGSACSQEMGAPQDDGRTFSGRDSGTATRMKNTSNNAMAVARATTRDSEYNTHQSISKAPLMLLSNICHIGKYNGESDCKNTGERNHGKEPPEKENYVKLTTYHVLIVINGIGAQVKKTVMRRKNFRPQTSDSAPIRGALRKERKPCK
ncbi:hypothetical protein J437_LFUL015848 [Ladona fulva]|uniref:Uncharacterized protein n=1 Tax=Ladona fulva TaxID=123851 RepID=A0A8K0P498_LADFU|nr:hypothetical protein J437_LFUL015848 [Ladona fulva]